MDIRIKEILKNKKGSSLAFVLIIGMVIMIMVASLLAVANSDFTFTQETVESRQAYIDAKSVIEYGKIAINAREIKLTEAYNELVAAMNDEDRAGDIPGIKQKIVALENEITTIFGNEGNVADTLSYSSVSGDEKKELGKVIIEKNLDDSSMDTSKYVFKVVTENLRRKLDYQVDFKYVVTTIPGTVGGFVVPTRPVAPAILGSPSTNISNWITSHITKEYSPDQTKCIIDTSPKKTYTSTGNELNVNASDLNLNVVDFAWANVKGLVLKAKNIALDVSSISADQQGATFNIGAVTMDPNNSGVVRFKKDFTLTQKSKMILSGKDIVFEGDLVIDSGSIIEINCDNLWIKGNLIIKTNNVSILNRFNAKNIIVGAENDLSSGDLTIQGASNVEWLNLDNLWIRDDLNLENWTGANNIENKIIAKNMIIQNENSVVENEINIQSGSKINLTCTENLWVDKIYMKADNNILTSTIKAMNIVIKDTSLDAMFIGDKTNTIFDATNLWLDGGLETQSTSANVKFNNINYMKTGDINLAYNSQLIITGALNKRNHLFVGKINAMGNSVRVDISNFCSFICDELKLNFGSSLRLDADLIKINGVFKLDMSGIEGQNSTLEVTSKYFDCLGLTTINNLRDNLNFNSKENILNIRFYGGYIQNGLSSDIWVSINEADKVIFGNPNGGVLEIYAKSNISIKSDAIYFDTKNSFLEYPSWATTKFNYAGKNTPNTGIFNILGEVLGKVGNYTNVSGSAISNLGKGNLPYEPPKWPEPLNCSCVGEPNSTIAIYPGTEKYY